MRDADALARAATLNTTGCCARAHAALTHGGDGDHGGGGGTPRFRFETRRLGGDGAEGEGDDIPTAGGGGGVTGGGGGLSARLSTVSWGGLREQAVTSAASLAVGAKRASASASTFVRELELAELRDSVSENG